MLKRQRQASPPPSTSIPFVADCKDDLLSMPQSSKRRRMAPPVLDGASRGWNALCPGDEEETYFSEDDEEDDEATTASQSGPSREYSATNNLLRELHTLNQHRLLFSPAKTPLKQSPTPHTVSYSPRQYDAHRHRKSELESSHIKDPLHSQQHLKKHDVLPNGDEQTHVLKRYEDTNRLLGELFLSRRRKLDDP